MSNAIAIGMQREVPWLGVGVSGEWYRSIDALNAANLNFTVRQEKLYWMREERDPNYVTPIVYNEPAPMFANIRDDDTLLGCVTPQYKIIQNDDAFSIVDLFISNGGVITHVGMTEDGLCFMVARMEVEREIGGDPYEINLMATNSFNSKYPCQIIMTPVRIYCQNMYRKLVNDRVFLIKHTTTANSRLETITSGSNLEKKVKLFSDVIEQSQLKSFDKDKLDSILAILFPYPKEKGPREDVYKLKADAARSHFVDRYFDAPDNRVHQGNAFGFINAYFDYLSHRDPMKNLSSNWADRRLSGIVSGIDVNRSLFKMAMA